MTRAGNWVDRNSAPEAKVAHCLAIHLRLAPKAAETELAVEARTVVQMVAANASEVQLAGYLRSLEDERGIEGPPGSSRRTMAVALWHIAKAGLVRDAFRGYLTENPPTVTADQVPLAEWLAPRIFRSSEPGPQEGESRTRSQQ